MAAAEFDNHGDQVWHQANSWAQITPNDNNEIRVPKALYIGGAGNIVLAGADGVDGTFAVGAGATLPLRPRKVKATGTTATGILALY